MKVLTLHDALKAGGTLSDRVVLCMATPCCFSLTGHKVAMTWVKIVRIEPRLKRLYAEISKIKDDKTKPSFCANAVWYGYFSHHGLFKECMLCLAGFYADKPELRTMETYNLVCDKLNNALPNCRNCGCL